MRILFLTAILLLTSYSASAQRPYTWDQMIAVQTNEREALHKKHDSELNVLTKIQMLTLEKMSGDHVRQIAEMHIVEREKLSVRHVAERTEQMKLHTHEREQFKKDMQEPPSKPEVG